MKSEVLMMMTKIMIQPNTNWLQMMKMMPLVLQFRLMKQLWTKARMSKITKDKDKEIEGDSIHKIDLVKNSFPSTRM